MSKQIPEIPPSERARYERMRDQLRNRADLLDDVLKGRARDAMGFDHIPELGRVRVIKTIRGTHSLRGKTGVALASATDKSGKRIYTVLIDTLNETYILAEESMEFLGWTVPFEQMYAGESIRVRVDKQGTSTVVRNGSKQSKVQKSPNAK